MLNLTRRNALLTAACAGAAFGLPKPVSFIEAALAQKGPEVGKGFRPFKFGKVQGFILNDGVWEKPHDLAFIQNVSVEETKAALAAAGIANDVDKVKQYEWIPRLFRASTRSRHQANPGPHCIRCRVGQGAVDGAERHDEHARPVREAPRLARRNRC